MANNVPDVNANRMIELCENISYDFSNIEAGEILYLDGHVGIYVGDRIVIEATRAWDSKVLDSYVSTNGDRSKYNIKVYSWEKHGKLPYIKYNNEYEKIEKFDVYDITSNTVSIMYETDLPVSEVLYSLDSTNYKVLESNIITNLIPNKEYNITIKVKREYTNNYTESNSVTFKTLDEPISLTHNIGDLVIVKGNIYSDPVEGNVIKNEFNRVCKITNIYNHYGVKYPYQIDGIGWVSQESIDNVKKNSFIVNLILKIIYLIFGISLIIKIIKSIF